MCCSSELSEESGQAAVEAAFLLPVVSLLILMLVQPLCLLYAKAVMWDAAAETARAALTSSDEEELAAFARRRLAAVPDAGLFHRGEWEVEIDGMEDALVTVSVRGHAEAMPLLGTLASVSFPSDGEGLILEASVSEALRPSWLVGSYDDWGEVWSLAGSVG